MTKTYKLLKVFLLIALSTFTIHVFAEQESATSISTLINERTGSLGYKEWVTLVVFALIFIGLIKEVAQPYLIFFVGTATLLVLGIITPAEFLSGFSNPVIMTIAMLCVVVKAIEINGLLGSIGRKILSKSKIFSVQLLSFCVPVSVASAFMNNTPIVLLMTPLIQKWALENKLFSSKFLIPLSYSAIFGGCCTLIGTSTNLIVHGLLLNESPDLGFSFFETAYVGVPCAIAGFIFLAIFGSRLLPERVDTVSNLEGEIKNLTVEFIIGPECPLSGQTVEQSGKKYHLEGSLIQVERNKYLIDFPRADFVLLKGDRLVFSSDIKKIAELHTIHDLLPQSDPHFKLDISSPHFSEIVIPTTSYLIGKTLNQAKFRNNYGASVIAIYRGGWRVRGNIQEVKIQAGDTMMLLSNKPHLEAVEREFYYIKKEEKLPIFHPWKAFLIILALVGFVTSTVLGVNIMISSVTTAIALLLTRCISIKEAKSSIVVDILLLIVWAFALGKALESTGVASLFAQIVLSMIGNNPYIFIGGILAISMIFTEFITNNAAALIIFPIAIAFAKLAGYDSPEALKAVGVAVAMGASCTFAVPTGYQTHMIVYGPGGYRFTDFLKIGIPMNILYWVISTVLITRIWGFF